MAERSKAYAWRAYDDHKSSVGSNPTLSASRGRNTPIFLFGGNMNTGKVLREYGIVLKKSLGQNFLKNESIPSRIVAEAGVTSDTEVIEIGVGAGVMTIVLAGVVKHLTGYEIDRRFESLHRDILHFPNVDIRYEDFLTADLHEFSPNNLMYVANIPYNLTSPIIEKILFNGPAFNSAILMVQKEYADRLLARPSTKEYGGLTVSVRTFATIERVFEVGRHEFIPEPVIDSTVIRVKFREDPPVSSELKASYRSLVKTAFSQRRKKLKNNLKSICKDPDKILAAVNLSPDVRAEELTVENFVSLYFHIRGVAHEDGDALQDT